MPLIRTNRFGPWKQALLAMGILFASVSSISCNVQSSAADNGGPTDPASAMVTFCDDGVSDCPAATSFSLSTIRDLVIKVDWYNLSAGNHVQRLNILLPEGGVYQMANTAFMVDSGSQAMFSSSNPIRMAGSWAAQRQEIGPWTVQVLLDGAVLSSQTVEMTK
ncbi:MAG TPA: hypothetical protein VMU43_11580 [Candidatus Acidoferrum sp.]|nr:hypothetical protein [Candidatus Acidoferrum sp.]